MSKENIMFVWGLLSGMLLMFFAILMIAEPMP